MKYTAPEHHKYGVFTVDTPNCDPLVYEHLEWLLKCVEAWIQDRGKPLEFTEVEI